MENKRESQKETLLYLEGLSKRALHELLQTPIIGDQVLELAVESPVLRERLDQILDEDFASLPPAIQEQYNQQAAEVVRSVRPSRGGAAPSSAKTIAARIARFAVEPWLPGPEVAIASGGQTSERIDKFVVKTDALAALSLQPYVRIDVIGLPDKPTVRFQVQRMQDPSRPGCYLEPKRRLIQFSLIRPTEAIRVDLGSNSMETPFRDSIQRPLKRYSPGEERQWQADLRVLPR